MEKQKQSIIYLAPRSFGKTTWLVLEILKYFKAGGPISDMVVQLPCMSHEKSWKQIYSKHWQTHFVSSPILFPTIYYNTYTLHRDKGWINKKIVFWDEPQGRVQDRDLFRVLRSRNIRLMMTWTPITANSFIDNPPDDFKILRVYSS